MSRYEKCLVVILTACMLSTVTGCDFAENNSECVTAQSVVQELKQEDVVGESQLSQEETVVFRPSYTKSFYKYNEEDLPVEAEDGMFYGWEDRLWLGCSTWCSVTEFSQGAWATSTLPEQGEFSYLVENIYNAQRENTWCEGVDGDGIGEYIDISQACLVGDKGEKQNLTFTELCIVNGYAATEEKWRNNNRVKQLKLYYEGQYLGMIELEDTMYPQYIDISSLGLTVGNGEEGNFRFEIADVYKGEKYDDTCITGILIEFDGRRNH